MTQTSTRPTTIGLLYAGEMGTALARLVQSRGHRVVTTCEGRGPRTLRNCRAAELEELPSLQPVVEAASILLAVVPPAAALALAQRVRERLGARGERLTYVDVNSVSPETARAIAAVFAGCAVDFVDGAVSGPAREIQSRGVLYLSGEHAGNVAALFEGLLRVCLVGETPGEASTLRMLLSGMTKGVTALFVEMALAARQAGILDRLLEAYCGSYAGVMELVERNLPTYPLHARRRGQELAEVEATLTQLGQPPLVSRGVRQLTVALATCTWDERAGSERTWSVPEVIDHLHRQRLFHLDASKAASEEASGSSQP